MKRTQRPASADQSKPPKPTTKTQSAKVRASGKVSLSGSDTPPPRRYRLTQREYAESYGKSLPTIKRWWKEGKPLDDADAMGEFLSARGRKPDVPIETEAAFESPSRLTLGDVAELAAREDRETLPIALDESFFAGEGILSAIERLKKAERERAAAYFEAIRRRVHPQILQNRFKEWTGIIETLRKVAKDEPEIRKLNELTIDRADVEAAIGQIFQAFRGAANNLPGRAASKLLGLRDHGEILDVLEREIEVLLRSLADITLDAVAQAEANAARAESGGGEPEEPIDREAPVTPPAVGVKTVVAQPEAPPAGKGEVPGGKADVDQRRIHRRKVAPPADA